MYASAAHASYAVARNRFIYIRALAMRNINFNSVNHTWVSLILSPATLHATSEVGLDVRYLRLTLEQQWVVVEKLINEPSPLYSGTKWPGVAAVETTPNNGPTCAARSRSHAPKIALAIVASGEVLNLTDAVVGRTPRADDGINWSII